MRYRDWQSRLAALIAERERMPFAWGSNDCCLFAADAVLAMTGSDPAANERGQYANELEAARLVKKLGGMAEIGAARFGDEVPVLMARLGDVVLVDVGRECLGVCVGEFWNAPGEQGMVGGLMSSAVKAWRFA